MDRAVPLPFLSHLPPRYRIDRVLSYGERSATLEAFDTGLRQTKAVLKVQRLADAGAATAQEAEGRFRRFCTTLASVGHDHIATPYTFGTFSVDSAGIFGYTTRAFVSGTPLATFPLPVPEETALAVAVQACDGLHAVHAKGLFHCDLKPENVVVRRAPGGRIDALSQCVLIDLCYRDETVARTLSDVTLQYVAPEMLEGRPPDPRADLYSLGVMLYRLLSGRFPFEADSLPETLRRQRSRQFTALVALCPAVSSALRRIVERLLEPNPANRPESAQALITLLEEACHPAPARGSVARRAAFVGREPEIEESLAALDVERPSAGVSSLEVCGPRGSGVTAFLRELQDRLEARGVTVLTAAPRAAGGVALHDQLRSAVHALARRPGALAPSTDPGVPGTSTDVLDDLFVAAHDRRVVLFVDDWGLCDVSETLFLQRLILQDKASMEGMARHAGRCQVVIGDSAGEGGVDRGRGLTGVVAKRIRLAGLDEKDTAHLLATEPGLSRLHARRVHAATGGRPKAIMAFLEHIAANGPEGLADRLEGALAAAAIASADAAREREVSALRGSPHGQALVALALWGDALPVERWKALSVRLEGVSRDDVPVDLVERAGRTLVRGRHRHLGEHVARCLDPADRGRIADAVLSVMRDGWRSLDSEELLPLLRVLCRLGEIPPRCRWRVCRALIVLLERGRFADVESTAAALGRCDKAPWWVGLFREAARVGSGGAQEGPREGMAPIVGDPASFFRDWIRARGLLRARYRREALGLFDALAEARFPWARATCLAMAEDHALAAAEAGAVETLTGLKRQILGRVRTWLPLIRRRRERDPASIRARLRACRRVARYQRVRSRALLVKGRPRRALAACRRERLLNRADGNLLREASCLNNEGILLIQSHAGTGPVAVLERCVRLRERLDDEHGLVIALNNLAAALSVTGNLGSAAAVLNRARIVATRNGLGRLRNSALVNLALAYTRRGQLRDAQRVLRHARRLGSHEGDVDAHARALYNSGCVAVDRWDPVLADGFAARLDALRGSAGYPRELGGDLVRAELAYRSRDWAHLHTLVARVRGQGLGGPTTSAHEERVSVESGNPAARRSIASEHSYPPGTRLRLALLRRRHRGIRLGSLGRVIAFARRHGLAREPVEWVLAHLERREGNADPSVDLGLKSLSWYEFREGHDDLQIEIRARLAGLLRARGRHPEAWRLIEDTLLRFRRLERRLRRWPRGAHLLLHLQERVRLALTGSVAGRPRSGQEMSAELCVQAFDLLMENRRRSFGTHDRHAAALLRLGVALSRGGDREAFVGEVLSTALAVTGAQRAVLVIGTAGAHEIRRVLLADGGESGIGNVEMSWAVVSQVLTSGQACVFSDALTAEELASHRSIAVLKLRSLACVPLRAGGRALGALYLDHHGIAGLIGEEMLGFLELLAGLIGTTLHVSQVDEQARTARSELAETHRHIMRAERNRLAGELAAGLVHDLKNVLAAVSGRAQLLRRANQDPTVLRSLDAIEKAAGTGVGLVQRLQECARDHSSQSEEEVDLSTVAYEALELLAPRLEKSRIDAEVRGAQGAVVWGVPGEFREMFLNLFVNACDAMPDGGKLSVSLAVEPEGGQIEATVADSGTGMSAETRARLFEPFYTTKGNKGTGLGLVVVRSVVVRHGGAITVESEPGSGSRFRIVLPCTKGAR